MSEQVKPATDEERAFWLRDNVTNVREAWLSRVERLNARVNHEREVADSWRRTLEDMTRERDEWQRLAKDARLETDPVVAGCTERIAKLETENRDLELSARKGQEALAECIQEHQREYAKVVKEAEEAKAALRLAERALESVTFDPFEPAIPVYISEPAYDEWRKAKGE